MLRRSILAGLCGASAGLWLPAAVSAAPLRKEGLGRGRYARLFVLLEKTVLDIEVLSLELRFDQATADQLEKLVKGQQYSKELEQLVVATAIAASDAYSGLRFMRDFGRDEFIEGVRATVRQAYEAKLIDRGDYQRTYDGLPKWFAFLGERGIRDGDWLYHRGGREQLRSVFIDRDGHTGMDVTLDGSGRTRTLLASYLAPGGDLREPLVRSLFG